MTKVLVFGGGIAGIQTALKLAKEGFEVIIIEEKEDILLGTSGNTPGRMGLGYHYFDLDTALRYIKQTVKFMKTYSDCFIGYEDGSTHLINGRYFVMKDSLKSIQDLMAGYDEVSKEFEKMCAQDSSNNIFGTTHLHRALRESEFEKDVVTKNISYAIETKERLLDWGKFVRKLKEEISSYPNIFIKTKTKVRMVSSDRSGLPVAILDNGIHGKEEKADYVVNCTWQNIEELNSRSRVGTYHFEKNESDTPKEVITPEDQGLQVMSLDSEARNEHSAKTKDVGAKISKFRLKEPGTHNHITSRLKLLAEVKLPKCLEDKPSMFFCVGPHAMFSNLGNGIARITFADVTNHSTTIDEKLPYEMQRILYNCNNASEKFKKFLGKTDNKIAFHLNKFIDSNKSEMAEEIKSFKDNGIVIPDNTKVLLSLYEKLSSEDKCFLYRWQNQTIDEMVEKAPEHLAENFKDFRKFINGVKLPDGYKEFLLIYDRLPHEIRLLLSGGMTKEEIEKFGNAIIEGVSKYIPMMKESQLLKVIPGIVKSRGSFDLHNVNSDFHKRDYSGVEEISIGNISNAAMKLFYCLGNAEEILNIIKKQELVKIQIKDILNFIPHYDGYWEDVDEIATRIKGQAINHNLVRNAERKHYESKESGGLVTNLSLIKNQVQKSYDNKNQLMESLNRNEPEFIERKYKKGDNKNIDYTKLINLYSKKRAEVSNYCFSEEEESTQQNDTNVIKESSDSSAPKLSPAAYMDKNSIKFDDDLESNFVTNRSIFSIRKNNTLVFHKKNQSPQDLDNDSSPSLSITELLESIKKVEESYKKSSVRRYSETKDLVGSALLEVCSDRRSSPKLTHISESDTLEVYSDKRSSPKRTHISESDTGNKKLRSDQGSGSASPSFSASPLAAISICGGQQPSNPR